LLIIGAKNERVVALDTQKNLALKLPNCKDCAIYGARHEVLMESNEFRSIFRRQFDSFIREEIHTNRKMDRI
jgi:alpha-beta hydrolase superfamily lysophospholipase